MHHVPHARLSFSPGIRAIIPLLYAAWSDQVLTPSEVTALQAKAGALTFLTDEDKAQLLRWSNPARIPQRELFKFWEISCQEAAVHLGESRKNLLQLGLFLAGHDPEENPWISQLDQSILQDLAESLGTLNLASYRHLFEPDDADVQAEEEGKASFSIPEMQALLDGDFAATKARALAVLQDPTFERVEMPVKEDYRLQVLKWCRLLAQQGFGGTSYPVAYGGKDDMSEYVSVFETLGYHDLSLCIKFGVQFGLWGGSVAALGTQKHHAKYLSATASMELPGCFAMTETGHGSNVRGLETTATYDPVTDEFVVDSPREEAGKEYIGNAMHAKVASVFAQLIVQGENHGVHAIVVPLRDMAHQLLPGIRVEDNGYKLGLNGVDNGRIWFSQVRVPRENLLDKYGSVSRGGVYSSPIENPSRRFFTMLGTLVGGRVCIPRAGLSAAKKALAIAIRYGAKRRQFAPNAMAPETPILDYPSHQRRLLPLVAKAYALQFGLDYLIKRYLNRDEADMREIETLAAGMKSYATWFTSTTIQECREACGGKGYLSENQFAHLKSGTDIFTTFEGDNTVLMQLVAKGLLTKYKQSFHEDGNLAILRIIGERMTTVVTEQNPLAIRNTDEDHLLSSDFHLGAFQFRERRLLYSLAQRLRGHIKDGKSAYEAGLICQTHMLTLAEAFVEQLTLKSMLDAIAKEKDKTTYPVLQQLAALYALQTMEQHAAWYLEQDYLAAAKSKAIRRQVDHLCTRLRPEAVALVEAFNIPDKLLAAPIAF